MKDFHTIELDIYIHTRRSCREAGTRRMVGRRNIIVHVLFRGVSGNEYIENGKDGVDCVDDSKSTVQRKYSGVCLVSRFQK